MNTFLLDAAPAGGGGNGLMMPLMMVAVFAVMYFFMIRPQRKKQKELEAMRNSLKRDDDIITAGGIHGKVMEVRDEAVIIAVESSAKIKIDKSSIAVINGQAGPAKK